MENNKYQGGCGEIETLIHSSENVKCTAATVESSLAVLQKLKYTATL